MFASLVHRLQELQRTPPVSAINRRSLPTTPAHLVESLPGLGNVLYVPMCPDGSLVRELPRGVVVEMMQLAPLMQTRQLAAASTITIEGPREWIDCLDREGRSCARLHLLPDTDYLAWDRLLARAKPVLPSGSAHRLRPARPACAKVLRFRVRHLAGLVVLGAEVCVPLSSLGEHLAGQIARAEAVPLLLANGV